MKKTMSTLLAVMLLGVGLLGCGNSNNKPAASNESDPTKAASTAQATSTTNAENTKEEPAKDFDNKELSIAVFQGDMVRIIGMKLSANSKVLIQV